MRAGVRAPARDKLSRMPAINRRQAIALLAAPAFSANAPLVDTHIHLFADDQKRFPYHRHAVYKPKPEPVEPYAQFVTKARIDRAIIVHPEPYQDDHSYLEYCFTREPSKLFFKGTCLFDAMSADTPARRAALVKKHPGRIVALRVHATANPSKYPSRDPAIRDRDLSSAEMKRTWKAASDLGLAIQMHLIPYYAQFVEKLAAEFRSTPVILDHLARSAQGTKEEYEPVWRMAKLPRVYMKLSAIGQSSKQPHPHKDVQPLIRRIYDSFGPERLIWGGVGYRESEKKISDELAAVHLAFAGDRERALILGGNAMKLFGWSR